MSEALKGALIIGQSGGPSSVINSSAYGCIRTALDADCITKVYGAYHGIKGVLNDELLCMDEEERAELDRLPYTPSSALGSCRYKIKDPDEDDTDYKRILEIFKKYDVRYFCYNGGNDSMDTCNKISKRSATSAASWASPRPSTMTCSAPTTAPATLPPPSISPRPSWKSPATRTSMTPA